MTATEKHRILVTVKTYPTLSRKYGETVCTAGVREDGTWVRIYPVDFGEFTPVGHIGISDRWNERRRILLKTARVYDTLSELIAAAKATQFHQVGPNPWVIIGVFPIPHDPQQRLFD